MTPDDFPRRFLLQPYEIGAVKRPWPKLYSFRVRLEGEKSFLPCSVLSVSEERAKQVLNQQFSGKIVEFRPISMIRELKRWEVTCDDCKTAVIVEGYYFRLPDDWGHRDVHGCGMTGYTRRDELCPKCYKQAQKELFTS